MKTKGLTSFDLKMIAIIAMVIDHIGHIFLDYPLAIPFRVIGRLTAPIMAFLIAEGYSHTKNVSKYMLRMFIFALISQIPYMLVINDNLNVLFTYLIAIGILELFYKVEDKFISFAFIASLLMISTLTDWGMTGVLFVLIFHIFRKDKLKQVLYFSIFSIIKYAHLCVTSSMINAINFAVLLSVIFILLYNNKRGRKMKYFFYAFYPAHLMILAIIKFLIK